MGKSYDELASYFRPKAEALVVQCNLLFPTEVIDTGRTLTEQAEKIANGVSWTTHSKHLPQPPEMKSEAIDIAPVHLMKMKNWAPEHSDWARIGGIGTALGLKWGVWKKDANGILKNIDPGHFEYIHEG